MYVQIFETPLGGNAGGRVRVVCAMADPIHNEEFERQHVSRNKQIEDLSTHAETRRANRGIWVNGEKEGDGSRNSLEIRTREALIVQKPSLECQGTMKVRILKKRDVKGPKTKPGMPACFEDTELEARWNALSGPPVAVKYMTPPDMPEKST